jgi:hypothetical protein
MRIGRITSDGAPRVVRIGWCTSDEAETFQKPFHTLLFKHGRRHLCSIVRAVGLDYNPGWIYSHCCF